MIDYRLSIPLQDITPATARLWRVVRVTSLIGLGVLIGILCFRLITFWPRINNWPEGATTAIYLQKTSENLMVSGDVLADRLINQKIPSSIFEELAHSERGITLFFDQQGQVLGFATDRKLSARELAVYDLWGLTIQTHGRLTIVSQSETERLSRVSFAWSSIWPQNDGFVAIKSDKVHISPISLTPFYITVRGDFADYLADSHLDLPEQTSLSAAWSTPKVLAPKLIPMIPSSFPGLQELRQIMIEHGFSMLLGSDTQGTSFSLYIRTEIDPENLAKAVSELLQISNLSTQDWTFDGNNYLELRGQEVTVELAHDTNLDRVVAEAQNGQIVRASQANNTLIISNRILDISQTSEKKYGLCSKQAQGFIQPLSLAKILPLQNVYGPNDFSSLVLGLTEISWSKTKIWFCW